MKVVQINTVCGNGSTGKICVGISQVLNNHGIENYILYTSGHSEYPYAIKCAERFPKLQALRSRILGNYGFNSKKTTEIMIAELERIKPDVVHLHNLHGHNCDLMRLMGYFKSHHTKLVWTFHDCWTFTGYCPYFVMAGCDKWKTGCHHCVQAKTFSWFVDRSAWLYEHKKDSFEGLKLSIVTPSQWLSNLVKESFLQKYPSQVIHNGIDLDIFQPKMSDFRTKHHIAEDKFILLGVAVQWVPRKGADVFLRLARKLDPGKFQIVLVGTDDTIDKQLPPNIISIHRTANQTELAEIYTAADLFVNPTREEVLGLVNIEANACGTPVLTYRTGGSPECIDETSGWVVDRNDEEALHKAILEIERTRPFSAENCRMRAAQFSNQAKYNEYVALYKQLTE